MPTGARFLQLQLRDPQTKHDKDTDKRPNLEIHIWIRIFPKAWRYLVYLDLLCSTPVELGFVYFRNRKGLFKIAETGNPSSTEHECSSLRLD